MTMQADTGYTHAGAVFTTTANCIVFAHFMSRDRFHESVYKAVVYALKVHTETVSAKLL
jgi:hypothetical protein